MLVHIASRRLKQYNRLSEEEFNLTKMFMDLFDLEVDRYFCLYDSLGNQLCSGMRDLGFAERYESIDKIPKDLAVFRPFRNEKHSNIIIQMFEDSGVIDYDMIEIDDYEKDGKTKYRGWLIKNGEVIDGSLVKTAPSVAILKMSIVASLMFDEDDHKEYLKNLIKLLRGSRRNGNQA